MRYTHDCDKCIPLWTCHKYDLYFCPHEPTIIARYGNEWEEYMSWLPFKDLYPLNRAYRRAIERWLIKPTKKHINWFCKCGNWEHEYFIICPVCWKENPLDGKWNLIK